MKDDLFVETGTHRQASRTNFMFLF